MPAAVHLLLIAVAALGGCARSATLRQYSRDWLIADEAAQPPRRITAKSVFVAPDFHEVRCPPGQRADAAGNCVRFVRVNQAAQLDFLLQHLNAMYGTPDTPFSGEKPQDSPFAGVKTQDSPFAGVKPQDSLFAGVKPQDTLLVGGDPMTGSGSEARPSDAVSVVPEPGQSASEGTVKPEGVSIVKHEVLGLESTTSPKSEPCVELPKGEETSTTTISTTPATKTKKKTTTPRTTTKTSSTPTTSPTEVTTPSSAVEASSATTSVQDVEATATSTSAAASSTDGATVMTVVATPEDSTLQLPEALLITGSDSEGSATLASGSSVAVANATAEEEAELVENSGSGDGSLLINDQAVKDIFDDVAPVKKGVFAESSVETQEAVESSTKVPVSQDKDVVDVDEAHASTTPEGTTSTDDDYDIIVEPEMGSGEREAEREVANVDTLSSASDDADLSAVLEPSNASLADKVLPVRNIIPEASSDRIHFVDSPITNIQPVRNTYPGDDDVAILDVDLTPNVGVREHNLNPSKLVPPMFVEAPLKAIPDAPFSLDEYLGRPAGASIPVRRPYDNQNFNPQQQNFPLHYQQQPFPPRTGFVRFPGAERDQVYQVDQRVNSVRFPPGEAFDDGRVRQWPSAWRPDNRRQQQQQRPPPVMRFWNKMPLIRNVEEPGRRYQQQHDRRRPPPQYYQ